MKYSPEICVTCGHETVSIIKTDEGPLCYNCYSEKKKPSKPKKKQGNEEARMQSEFFRQVPVLFPNLPSKLLFAVPNGGSRNKIEAANLKRQGATAGVADVICLIPKKGFASLCLEFKIEKGKQSEHQKEFQKQAESCRNKYVIVRSVKEAIEELRLYLF